MNCLELSKIGGYRQSWGGSFLEGPLFKGARGGVPPSFTIFYPPKLAKLANLKSRQSFGAIGTPEPDAISDSPRRGGGGGI